MLGPVLAAVFALGWIPLYAYRAEAMHDALPHYAGAERRWVKLSPVVVAAHVTLACIAVSVTEPPAWRAALGVALFAAGVSFWFWGRLQIGPLRVTRLPDQPPLALRRDGAFALVRNPLYFAYLVAALAPVIVAARPLLLATFAACFGALAMRATQEERRLHAQLGAAYAEYCRAVKRLIPFVW
jgi:protein-S-isoprenylcysteine O-methyltransferase Ste14